MNGPELNAILVFYGMPAVGSEEDRRHRLKQFIGIRI